jgi:hypothetical protein
MSWTSILRLKRSESFHLPTKQTPVLPQILLIPRAQIPPSHFRLSRLRCWNHVLATCDLRFHAHFMQTLDESDGRKWSSSQTLPRTSFLMVA